MERVPKSGELYRHFKGKLYQVMTVAKHSETGEELVIYQALYGDYQVYARPLAMFVSEVDRMKYPQVTQRYRFEQIERETLGTGDTHTEPVEALSVIGTQAEAMARHMRRAQAGMGIQTQEPEEPDTQTQEPEEPQTRQQEPESEINAKLMAFFDADDMEERYNILISMRDEVDDLMINNMAVVVDVVIPEGDISDRYEQLKRCIRTRQRYEAERLR